MIIRLVRMTFEEDKVKTFLEIFERSKHKIRAFEGCKHLTLLRDVNQNNIFTTLSHWESESALETYRNSEFFQKTWAHTKILFKEKPIAYSNFIASVTE